MSEAQFHQPLLSPEDQESSESHIMDNSDYSIDELFVSSDDSNLDLSVVTISLY